MKTQSAVHPLRMRKFEGNAKDPYAIRGKLSSPTVCPECRALYERGRWRWRLPIPKGAARQLCQACRRIRQRYPAGLVRMRGPFVKKHRAEVIGIVRRAQRKESADHPLNRVMAIQDRADGLLVTTTDVHLPRLIGEALRRAEGGVLHLRYDAGGCAIRVDWDAPYAS